MIIIGHRGARGLAPENTAKSLQKGLEHHVAMVEFDVRVTKDAIPILHHAESIVAGDKQRLRIKDHSCSELKEHFPPLTTLEHVFDIVNKKAVLYIEVKAGEPVEPIVSVLETHIGGRYKATDLRLASKSQKTLRALHAALPEVPKIVIHSWSGAIATRRAKQVDTKLLAMNQLWLWRGFIVPMAKRGWQLYAYTVNDAAKAKRWKKYGLAGIVTDYPDRFQGSSS